MRRQDAAATLRARHATAPGQSPETIPQRPPDFAVRGQALSALRQNSHATRDVAPPRAGPTPASVDAWVVLEAKVAKRLPALRGRRKNERG